MGRPLLEFRAVSKAFGGHRVLHEVGLALEPGEIHALVGENGAGKSTLMNILFGMPVVRETGGYGGEVLWNGEPVRFSDPREAMQSGIGMIHQEFMLIDGFTAAENIKLNREPLRSNPLARLHPSLATLDRPRITAEAQAALREVGLGIDAWAAIAGLPVGHRQFVEIARELDKERVRLLVLDEPTAVLTESEAEVLLDLMRGLARRGIALLFISHRLHEVTAVADRITVLRDGAVVGRLARGEATIEMLADLMVGRRVESLRGERPAATAGTSAPALRLRGLRVHMAGEEVRGADLEVRRGEILGIGGLAGQGKVGLANGIMGLVPSEGVVEKDGEPLALGDPAAAIRRGLAFVSEDRRGAGLLPEASIELNIALPAIRIQRRFLRRWPLGPLRPLDGGAMRAHAESLIRLLDIRCTGPAQVVRRLSGGNQQKVCLARAITLEPEILLVSEPTRGIDVGAKQRVLDLLVEWNRERGLTVVVTSSELAELRAICDRVAIVTGGRVQRILAPDAPNAAYGLAMAGEPPSAA